MEKSYFISLLVICFFPLLSRGSELVSSDFLAPKPSLFQIMEKSQAVELIGNWESLSPPQSHTSLFSSFQKIKGLLKIHFSQSTRLKRRISIQFVDGNHYQDRMLELELLEVSNTLNYEGGSLFENVTPVENRYFYRGIFPREKDLYNLSISYSAIKRDSFEMVFTITFSSFDHLKEEPANDEHQFTIKASAHLMDKSPPSTMFYIYITVITLLYLGKLVTCFIMIRMEYERTLSRLTILGILLWDIGLLKDYLYPINSEVESCFGAIFSLISVLAILFEFLFCGFASLNTRNDADNNESDKVRLIEYISYICLAFLWITHFNLYQPGFYLTLCFFLVPQILTNMKATLKFDKIGLLFLNSIISIILVPFSTIFSQVSSHFYQPPLLTAAFIILIFIQFSIIFLQAHFSRLPSSDPMPIPNLAKPYLCKFEAAHSIPDHKAEDSCPICLMNTQEDLEANQSASEQETSHSNQGWVKTPCGHIFHKKCLTPWVENKPNCPVCRSNFQSVSVEYII